MNAADPNNDHHHPNSVGHTAGAYGGVDRDPGNGPSRSERGSRARATFEAFKQWRHDRNNVTHAKGAGAGKGGGGGGSVRGGSFGIPRRAKWNDVTTKGDSKGDSKGKGTPSNRSNGSNGTNGTNGNAFTLESPAPDPFAFMNSPAAGRLAKLVAASPYQRPVVPSSSYLLKAGHGGVKGGAALSGARSGRARGGGGNEGRGGRTGRGKEQGRKGRRAVLGDQFPAHWSGAMQADNKWREHPTYRRPLAQTGRANQPPPSEQAGRKSSSGGGGGWGPKPKQPHQQVGNC
jgi:hypothetical protein